MTVAAKLYDAGRGVYYAKPAWRGRMHLAWFGLSLVAGPLLVLAAAGAGPRTALGVYAASVTALFGTSALYHRGTWGPAASRLLQRCDHTTIFLLIGGTATPVFLLGAPPGYGRVCLVVTWSLTAAAVAVHLAWMHAPEVLVGGTYIGLGCTAGLAVPPLWVRGDVASAVLVVVGGVLYATGAVLYHRRRPDPRPATFGYHEVFHAFVCAAATCQFLAISLLVV